MWPWKEHEQEEPVFNSHNPRFEAYWNSIYAGKGLEKEKRAVFEQWRDYTPEQAVEPSPLQDLTFDVHCPACGNKVQFQIKEKDLTERHVVKIPVICPCDTTIRLLFSGKSLHVEAEIK